MTEIKLDMLTYFERHYPITTKLFLQWLIGGYPQYSVKSFCKLSLEERYLIIMRYFGMPIVLPEKYDHELLKTEIQKAMQDYEDIQNKYGSKGVPDFMKEINFMSREKRQKFDDFLSITDKFEFRPQISLSNALYDLSDPIVPLTVKSFKSDQTGEQNSNDYDMDAFIASDDECPF